MVDGGTAFKSCHFAAHKFNTIFCTICHGQLTNIAAIRQRQLCTFLNRQALKCAIWAHFFFAVPDFQRIFG